jgi:hypothetical protein
MNVQVFLQSELLRDIEVLELPRDTSPKGLRDACIAKLPQELDAKEFHLFVEDDDDEQPAEKLKQIPEGLRVHLHRLKGIDVTVRYGGRDVRRTFRPSATVGRIKRWSTHELGIAPSDAAELMLQISGTENRPDADTHVGSLVQLPARSISFDLVPSPRING